LVYLREERLGLILFHLPFPMRRVGEGAALDCSSLSFFFQWCVLRHSFYQSPSSSPISKDFPFRLGVVVDIGSPGGQDRSRGASHGYRGQAAATVLHVSA